MRNLIVSVTDQKTTAQALEIYLRAAMSRRVDFRYMTYHDTRYSPELVRQADLFLLELFATDSRGLYTEGILAAEKWLSLGKRVLVLSGAACAGTVNSPVYWDLGASDDLSDRIASLVEAPLPKLQEWAVMRACFHRFYRRAEDPHKTTPGSSSLTGR